jgi:hypothetical protein
MPTDRFLTGPNSVHVAGELSAAMQGSRHTGVSSRWCPTTSVLHSLKPTTSPDAYLQFSQVVFIFPLQEVDLLEKLALMKFKLPHMCCE